MEDHKMKMTSIVKSKTMWVAVLTGMVGAGIEYMPFIKDSIPPDMYGFVLMMLGIVMGGLRVVTTMPLKDK